MGARHVAIRCRGGDVWSSLPEQWSDAAYPLRVSVCQVPGGLGPAGHDTASGSRRWEVLPVLQRTPRTPSPARTSSCTRVRTCLRQACSKRVKAQA